jgi:hypothetical protein
LFVPALLTVAAGCVGVLAYVASKLITLAERRSVYTSIAVAVGMSVGFVALVRLALAVIVRYQSP